MLRVEDMVHGQWYYVQTSYEWLLKFDKLDPDNLYATRFIRIDQENPEPENRTYHNPRSYHKEIRDAVPAEVLRFFPDEKFAEADEYDVY